MKNPENMKKYFAELEKETFAAHKIASKARSKGYDPSTKPEVVLAKNLAERVIGLISVVAPQIQGPGAIKRVVELEKKYGTLDWRVAFKLALEVAQEKFCKFSDKREAMEVGIRTGFAYVTLGTVSAPLEGFTKLEIKQRNDGKGEYFCLYFSGPVRAAGGTASSVCVLIGDYVRKQMGYQEYDPTEKEVKRCHAELTDYHEYITNLQYYPSKEEADFLVEHIPVQIAGDPSEKYEISNVTLKDIPRVSTNRIRSGYCLVFSAGLPLKAPKLWAKIKPWGRDMDMHHWSFLEEFLRIQKLARAREEIKQKGKDKDEEKIKTDKKTEKIKPDFTYVSDLVAGRPVFGHPLSNGAFRLRYGRARTSGYSAQSIHPATMYVLDEFIAIATQLKLERPGKATVITSCDSIDGPVVKLKNGSVVFVETEKQAKQLRNQVEEIIYLGDILVNYGDFYDRAHILVPAGYVPEEWILELEQTGANLFGTFDSDKISELVDIGREKLDLLFKKPLRTKISFNAAYQLSRRMNLPLHPQHIFFWNSITPPQLLELLDWFEQKAEIKTEDKNVKIILPKAEEKRYLELIGLPHSFVNNEYVVIEGEVAKALLGNLNVKEKQDFEKIKAILEEEFKNKKAKNKSTLELINQLSDVEIRDKAGIFIGSRMGRPEKAKMRKLTGSPHVLFPVGKEGGKFRSFQSALEKGVIKSHFTPFYCKRCKRESVFSICEVCDKPTEKMNYCEKCGLLSKSIKEVVERDVDGTERKYHFVSGEKCKEKLLPYKKVSFNIKESFPLLLNKLGTNIFPDLIKGVRGTSNKEHIPEHLVKGILRAKHKLCVNKDGTIRYDCSEIPLTHFKPKEAGVSVEKLKELGYAHDIKGAELKSEEQTLELKSQDILLPCSPVSPEEPANEILFRTANFIDELLTSFYGLKPFYNLKTKENLIGHLAIGLAPHTSAGILCRIIGFSKSQGFVAHPYIHAAMRRDCFTYDTIVPVKRGQTWELTQLGELVDKLNPKEVVDNFGTREIKVKGFKTMGLKNGKLSEVNVRNFTKHTPQRIIRLRTKLGRTIKTTENHKHIVFSENKDKIKKGFEIGKGDLLKIPYCLKVAKKDIKKLDLIGLFNDLDWVMIRGLKKQLSDLNKKLACFDLSKTQIYNYVARDSIPLKYAKLLVNKYGVNKDNLFISAKRDHVKIPATLKLNEDLLKTFGLYIAEGYSRKNQNRKGFYQIYIAAGKAEIRHFIRSCFKNYFGLNPSENKKDRVTFSSRILYELFTNLLGMGSGAYEKRISKQFLNLPNKKLGWLLSGYLEGDGSVSKTDLRITFDTVSQGLLRDLEFVFGQMGVFVKYRKYTKEPGDKVKQFYIKKGRKIPAFTITKGILQSKFMKKISTYLHFISIKKQETFEFLLANKKFRNLFLKYDENFFFDEVINTKILGEQTSYCLNVDKNIVIANGILTKQCDGDEGCILLLMDALINFSKKYLPESRGSTMDAPLVLTYILNPSEVDDMVFNMDIVWRYPLKFYQACREYKMPWEVKIKQVRHVLGTLEQHEKMGFTHDTEDINQGVLCSAYKLLPSMEDKLKGQMQLAEKIRAVNTSVVAGLVIDKHFMKDTKGNLRKFSQQEFRCVNCNEKFRRPPLSGKCSECDGKIIFTVSEGFVIKYLELSMKLAEKYNVPVYTKQTLELLKQRVEGVFGREKERQQKLGSWLSV